MVVVLVPKCLTLPVVWLQCHERFRRTVLAGGYWSCDMVRRSERHRRREQLGCWLSCLMAGAGALILLVLAVAVVCAGSVGGGDRVGTER